MADNELERLRRRCERERKARQEAEVIAERTTRTLYDANEALRAANVRLSTPVLRIWEGVFAAPLVGEIDEERGRQLQEVVLGVLKETRSRHVIVDLTGVPHVGAEVGQLLRGLAVSIRLMGARMRICGVSTELAQTMAADLFAGIETHATMADALKVAIDGART